MEKLVLDNITKKVNDLPALPTIVNDVIKLTEDPYSTVKDIERVIMKDQGLTSRILRLANSVHYGYARRISTISEASTLLGFEAIKSMTLAASVNGLMIKKVPGYGLDENQLWIQSQSCAMISRYISKKIRYPYADQAYVAGLLRDIGKMIISYYLVDYSKEIMIKIEENPNLSFVEVEEMVLGFNHSQIGAQVAKKWNLPDELIEAIAYHHTPEKATVNFKLTSIVHVADAITMMLGIGLGVDGLIYNLSKEALESIGIDEHGLEQFFSDASDLLMDKDVF
ncbi:HDOD domain-containing protein [Alkalibaculum sp. M08DMB]|uniref:HDOD domain-containing protein n=1 Tax=Alkalibaculum sporogenes TaxID=2655001 RepID=A0A6A7K4W8_9FIRM|nr:HDOD domain-containing protein [Alkalibaculum sporogenes]MPW24420.1 HDOD domain-containing protein [Alkalibaculum sporogenes]